MLYVDIVHCGEIVVNEHNTTRGDIISGVLVLCGEIVVNQHTTIWGDIISGVLVLCGENVVNQHNTSRVILSVVCSAATHRAS